MGRWKRRQTSPQTCSNSKSFGPSDATLLGEGLSSALSSFSAAPVNPLKPAPYLVAPRTLSSPSFSRTRLAPYQSAKISYNKNGNRNVFKHHTNVINNRIPTNLKSVNKIRGAQKSIDSPPLAHKSGISQSDRCPKGLSQSAHLVAQKSKINDPKNCDQTKMPNNINDPKNCDHKTSSTKGKTKSAERFFLSVAPYGAKPSCLEEFDQGPTGTILGQGSITRTTRGTIPTSYGGNVSIRKVSRGTPRYNGTEFSRPANCSRVPVAQFSSRSLPSTQTGGQVQTNRDLSQTWRYRVLCCHVFCHVVVMSSHYSI